MRYVFFINPVAGKGKGPALLTPVIEEYCTRENLDYKIIITEAKGDALNKARLEAETGDDVTLFACGGDGTFFEVLNGAYPYKNVVLGAVPCGSGNDFLKNFGSASDFMNIENQLTGAAVPMDIVMVDDVCCMNTCSMGMDAVVANSMTSFKKLPLVSGALAYKLAVVKTFFGKLGINVTVKADGETIGTFPSLFVVCGNGTTYGGGYRACPNADPSDAKLDWVIVEKISKLKILKFLKIFERGEHIGLSFVKNGVCTVMELSSEKPAPISIDGEIVFKDKVRFELVKGGIRFVLPRGICEKYSEKETAISR